MSCKVEIEVEGKEWLNEKNDKGEVMIQTLIKRYDHSLESNSYN